MNKDSCFSVVSFNVRGLVSNTHVNELTLFLSAHKPSVLILQEPQIDHRTTITKNGKIIQHTPVELPKFRQYASLHFTHPTKPTGVVFYIHKSCTYRPIHEIPHSTPYRPSHTHTIAAFVWISHPLLLGQAIVVGGVYLHSASKEEDVTALASNIALASQPLPGSPLMSPSLPVFVFGDFNARHKSWDPHIADAKHPCMKGRWVSKRLITTSTATRMCRRLPPLTLINNMFTTSRMVPTREESGTVIDLAMTSHPNMVEGMYILSDAAMGSDHWPIAITLKQNHIAPHMTYAIPHAPSHIPYDPADFENKYNEQDEKHGQPQQQQHQQHTTQPSGFYLETSTIPGAGLGMKANKRYKKGERIVPYEGERIDEAMKKQGYPNNEGQYVMYVMRDLYIDAVDPRLSSAARYINSSGGGYNNAAIKPHHRQGTHTINIVATRDIAPGEEIFMPYGSSYHMMRAPPPNRTTVTTPTSHWEQHMRAP